MSTLTKGHLSTNGGIRGHSAGDIFPYRIMIQGTFDALKYYVINPDGTKHIYVSFTASAAYQMAVMLKHMNARLN